MEEGICVTAECEVVSSLNVSYIEFPISNILALVCQIEYIANANVCVKDSLL